MSEDAHILVVEDDARLRERLARYLVEQGFRVTTAEHAADARDRLRFIWLETVDDAVAATIGTRMSPAH